MLRKNARNIALDQLLPRIAKENQIAVETIKIPIYFYRKLRGAEGRRCSCFDVEISPTYSCRACWGTGIVGGYEKHGTHSHVLDVTHPSIRAFNVIPDYSRKDKPTNFILTEGAVRGRIIYRVRPKTNIGTVDHVFAKTSSPGGSYISAYIKAPSDPEWQDFTKPSVAQRLFNPYFDVMVELKRASVAGKSPRFALLYMRYNRTTEQVINANIPKPEYSSMLQEFGVADEWQEQNFYTDNTLRAITSDDWVAHINDSTRWKITSVSPFNPEGLILSWEFNTRLVRKYDAINVFPL